MNVAAIEKKSLLMETEGKYVIVYCNSNYKTTSDMHIFHSCPQGAPKILGMCWYGLGFVAV